MRLGSLSVDMIEGCAWMRGMRRWRRRDPLIPLNTSYSWVVIIGLSKHTVTVRLVKAARCDSVACLHSFPPEPEFGSTFNIINKHHTI
jgi:hypothetical protein